MPGVKNTGAAPLGTVYGELKLSEKLSDELNLVKSIVDQLNEGLEESNYYRELFKTELDELQVHHKQKIQEVKLLKNQLIELKDKSKTNMI